MRTGRRASVATDCSASRLVTALAGWQIATPSTGRCVVGVLPGEGVGTEVIDAAVMVLQAAAERFRLHFDFRYGGPIGVAAEQAFGRALTPEVEHFCETTFADGGAIFCGPGGGRFVYDLRRRFKLFCKLAPIRPLAELDDCGVIRPEARRGVDIVVVRENMGGIYFGKGARYVSSANQRCHSRHTFHYSDSEVRRIVDVAANLAERRRRLICLAVKPAGVRAVSDLWMDVFAERTAGRDVQPRVLEVDNAGYQIVAAARDFDVVVAPNMFGDILADEAALLLGSRGMSYSANFGSPGVAVYQTGHGAAHDLAGKGVANPIGQILSAAMMLRESFQLVEAAAAIEKAVAETLAAGMRTADIAGHGSHVVGTHELARHIAANVRRRSTAAAVNECPSGFIAGRWHEGRHLHRIERRNPSNWDEILARVPIAGADEVAQAAAMAAEAQRSWRCVAERERAAMLAAWASELLARSDELTGLLAREIGKPIREAREEISRAAAMIRMTARTFGVEQRQCLDAAAQVFVHHRPHGVVGMITPWNNAIAIPAGKIAAALALGNGVVWKPAIEAPRCAMALIETLLAAVAPAGLVNLVFGEGHTAGCIIGDSQVGAVTLTGAIRTGRRAAVRCAELGKPFQGELGGNNAAIVLRDCDSAAAARGLALAAFSFAGQRCTALRRFIVERDIIDVFQAHLVAAASSLRVGDPGDERSEVGPLISRLQRDAVLAKVQQAVAEGGRLLCGGAVPTGLEHGCWLTPTVIADIAPESRIVQDETFGPLAVVQPADDLEHALALANGVQQGLVAAILGGTAEQRRRFAEGIEAGIVKLDAGPLAIHADAPFGGWKASGFGPPEHGECDRQFYARLQALYGEL